MSETDGVHVEYLDRSIAIIERDIQKLKETGHFFSKEFKEYFAQRYETMKSEDELLFSGYRLVRQIQYGVEPLPQLVADKEANLLRLYDEIIALLRA